jgi:hypothetical protein
VKRVLTANVIGNKQRYTENTNSDLKLAGAGNNYSCNSENCYQYPSISGFYNKTN